MAIRTLSDTAFGWPYISLLILTFFIAVSQSKLANGVYFLDAFRNLEVLSTKVTRLHSKTREEIINETHFPCAILKHLT